MRLWLSCILSGLALASVEGVPGALRAQEPAATLRSDGALPGELPAADERVRFRPSVTAGRRWCDGRVALVAGDTLVVAGARGCPSGELRQASIADVRIARGDHGSRLTHAVLGVLGGAVVGGGIGRLAAGDGCRRSGCSDGGYAVGVLTGVGLYAGALVGGTIGLALPAGTRWVAVRVPRHVRVAGLVLRPDVRLIVRRGR